MEGIIIMENGRILYSSENGEQNLIAGTVSYIHEGVDVDNNNYIQVRVILDKHDRDIKEQQVCHLYITIRNCNTEGNKTLLDHVKKTGIKVGSFGTFLTGIIIDNDQTEDGNLCQSTIAYDFQRNYRWVFNEGSENERNIIVGTVRTIRSKSDSDYTVGIPINTTVEGEETVWYNVGFVNSEYYKNADKARSNLAKGKACALIAGKLKIQEYGGRVYNNLFGLDMVLGSVGASVSALENKESVQPKVKTAYNKQPKQQSDFEKEKTVADCVITENTKKFNDTSTHDVFISHSSKDKRAADAICHSLEENGIRCWIAPRDVNPGFEYAAEIIRGVKNCKVFLLIFSKDSNTSKPVAKEIESAFRYEKTVIPFRIDRVDMTEALEYYLSNLHWMDAYPNDNEFDLLVKAVRNALGVNVAVAPAREKQPSRVRQTVTYGKKAPTAQGKTQKVKSSVRLHPVDERLYNTLLGLKLEIANELDIPENSIFYNSTLVDMCMKLPANSDELLNISGIGAVKSERYGKQFLKAIADFIKDNGIKDPPENFAYKNFLESDIEISEDAVLTGMIADRINCVLIQCGIKKISRKIIDDWLVTMGYMEVIEEDGNKHHKPTLNGTAIGIVSEERLIRDEVITVYCFSSKAQELVTSKTLEILGDKASST